ncbi:MAG TPA: P-II family nitrogen regulator [Thermoleophilaceae bacterium]|nr:P-II family nitrogen regulator [Thermoleophilaceae bacterium]
MFKVVIAYVDAEMFEPIRKELVAQGVLSISAMSSGGSSPDQFVAPHYRGTVQTYHLAEKLRLECVVGASHADAVMETIRAHEGRRPTFAFVMDVPQVSRVDSILVDPDEDQAGLP